MMKIDLGTSYEEVHMPTAMPTAMPELREKHYPSFTYDGKEKLELPDEGTMTIHFCKVGSSEQERDGKKHYSCTVEVKHILDIVADDKDDAPSKKLNRAEDALDALMADRMKEKNEEAEEDGEDY